MVKRRCCFISRAWSARRDLGVNAPPRLNEEPMALQVGRWRMARGPLLTEAEKGEVWARRARGAPPWMIARHMGRHRRAVHDLLAATGWGAPHQPQRSRRRLKGD